MAELSQFFVRYVDASALSIVKLRTIKGTLIVQDVYDWYAELSNQFKITDRLIYVDFKAIGSANSVLFAKCSYSNACS